MTMRPPRPTELDMLNVFVGRWEWDGEGRIAGRDEPLTFSGRRESRWEGDGWYLVTREVGTMEGLGESRTLAVWSYDSRAGCFRTFYVDSMATTMIGTARFDEKTSTWHAQATSYGPSGTASASGRIRFPEADRMEWDWTEHGPGGRTKTIELAGVCRRTP